MSEIQQLKQRVNELEQRVAELEDKSAESGRTSDLFDRYDEYVLDRVESATDTHPRRLMCLYEESGIVDKKKQKKRAKRLRKMREKKKKNELLWR